MKNRTEESGYTLLSVGGDIKRRLLLNVGRLNGEEYSEKTFINPIPTSGTVTGREGPYLR